MKITIAAIGRLKRGPEQELLERYRARSQSVGRSLGLSDIQIFESSESQAQTPEQRKSQEAEALLNLARNASVLICMDETGSDLTSHQFSQMLSGWREEGTRELAFLIGGADGLDSGVRSKAQLSLRLGKMTWPHQIARILLMEQIYRATTILTGHPYHRQ